MLFRSLFSKISKWSYISIQSNIGWFVLTESQIGNSTKVETQSNFNAIKTGPALIQGDPGEYWRVMVGVGGGGLRGVAELFWENDRTSISNMDSNSKSMKFHRFNSAVCSKRRESKHTFQTDFSKYSSRSRILTTPASAAELRSSSDANAAAKTLTSVQCR